MPQMYFHLLVCYTTMRVLKKWELGFACFCTGKMEFWSLGLGFGSEKKPKWEWDWCFVSISVGSGHWLVDLEKNGGWEMGLVTPLQNPLLYLIKTHKICTFRQYSWTPLIQTQLFQIPCCFKLLDLPFSHLLFN